MKRALIVGGVVVVAFIVWASRGGQPKPKPAEDPVPQSSVEHERRVEAVTHCDGMTAAARNRDLLCLYVDCPGAKSSRFYEQAAAKQVAIGMDVCLVTAAWGEPTDMRKSTTARGTTYHAEYGSRRRVMFDEAGFVALVNE